MKISIKPGLIIFHDPKLWEPIQYQLGIDHGTRVLISYVCRRELGFTVRRHKAWVPWSEKYSDDENEFLSSIGRDLSGRYTHQMEIHLDFYDQAQQTWFVLKYLNSTTVDQ
jgi:hypothetical protein